jgi:hypothetical protein
MVWAGTPENRTLIPSGKDILSSPMRPHQLKGVKQPLVQWVAEAYFHGDKAAGSSSILFTFT